MTILLTETDDLFCLILTLITPHKGDIERVMKGLASVFKTIGEGSSRQPSSLQPRAQPLRLSDCELSSDEDFITEKSSNNKRLEIDVYIN